MTEFYENHGYAEPKAILDERDIPDRLRNRIWNVLDILFFRDVSVGDGYSQPFQALSLHLRHNFFGLPIDMQCRSPHDEREILRTRYFELEFPQFYRFLEQMLKIRSQNGHAKKVRFKLRCNQVFRDERTRFRFVGNTIAPITAPREIEEIEKAETDEFGGEHIRQAMDLYSKKPDPDYRNSIKESISAVEATYRTATGSRHRNIACAIKAMENEGIFIPPALKSGFSAIYGWTSDENGIRHALMESSSVVGEAEARLMLVMCSAYVNYLKSLQSVVASK